MTEELFDICDEHDEPIGVAPRSLVHAQQLWHRAVHIWLFNSRQELLIHLRSDTKDEYPACYTSSASGHLAVGEDYATAASRELQEELGLSGQLEYICKLRASAQTAYEHTVLYRLTTDATPRPDPVEIARIEYHPLSVVKQMVADAPQKFTPPFKVLLDWWLAQFGTGLDSTGNSIDTL